MKSKDRPVISTLPSKNDKDRLGIRLDFLSRLSQEIASARFQQTFATPGTPHWQWWEDELKKLYKQRDDYGE